MENFESKTGVIAECFTDAINFQKTWIEKLQNADIKNKSNFLYSSVWKKNNQLAKLPKD